MATRTRQLACYVSTDVLERFYQYARASGAPSASEALRELVEQAIGLKTDHNAAIQRRLIFIEIATDALLAAGGDNTLRAATHNIFQERLRTEGLAQ